MDGEAPGGHSTSLPMEGLDRRGSAAELIGFNPFRSRLLAVGDRAEPYRIDTERLRAPVPIAGITVSAERLGGRSSADPAPGRSGPSGALLLFTEAWTR